MPESVYVAYGVEEGYPFLVGVFSNQEKATEAARRIENEADYSIRVSVSGPWIADEWERLNSDN